MGEPLSELRKIRLEKLNKLKDLGTPAFPQPKVHREPVEAVRGRNLESRAEVCGRLRSIRGHGGSTFADLEDESGKIQLFLSKDVLGSKNYDRLDLLDIGDFLFVQGTLFKTVAGELTIKVSDFQLLSKSLRPLPSSFYGLKDVEEKYRQRYVDLAIDHSVRNVFKLRSRVVSKLRELLDKEGFLEVETPVLQPLYGGATANPFTTYHNALNTNLYLRISDELYLKRLIVGGFEKVYEIAKDFRNEGMDREHNPEFTMLEFYWAYSNYEDLMRFSENLLSQVVKEITGGYVVNFEGKELNFEPPWERITFHDALIKYIDLDINKLRTEAKLLEFVGENDIQVDLSGVVGLAPILDEIYKKTVRQKLTGPLFLTDHPYEMRPLAKRREDDTTKAASFQLLVCGRELINAYNELNDPLDQRARWEEEARLAGKGLAEYQVLDEDYIRALEYGMPPTAGWGMGIDRFVSILTNNHTIKDVILFPTLRPEKGTEVTSGGEQVTPNTESRINDPSRSGILSPASDVAKLPIEPKGDFPGREKVFQIVSSHIKNQNLLRHCLAVEAAMRALARRLGGNVEAWGSLGLIHDADWEETKSDPARHTADALEWLAGSNHKSGPVVQGLKSHNNRHTKLAELQSLMEWSLECCDELTGFIVSVALVRPDKKLSSVEVESVLKKWKAKEFAAAVDRSQIAQCEEKLGIKLEEFIGLVLESMKRISHTIGL
jgi:lysyl-tRNA synthetase class 2